MVREKFLLRRNVMVVIPVVLRVVVVVECSVSHDASFANFVNEILRTAEPCCEQPPFRRKNKYG